jgi:hypothetical protein
VCGRVITANRGVVQVMRTIFRLLPTFFRRRSRDGERSTGSHHEAGRAAPRTVVTLVHGTWARRAAWTEADSVLCRAIRQRVPGPVEFRIFSWSGTNSLVARAQAANDLREFLRASHEAWPDARHFIVAHSHAGNIAFYALRDTAVAYRTCGLVCLSTPFIHARPRDLGQLTGLVRFAAPLGLLLFVTSILSAMFGLDSDVWALTLFLFSFAAALFISVEWENVSERLLELTRPARLNPDRVLLIRATGDEASSALAVLPFLSWIVGWLWLRPAAWVARAIAKAAPWADRVAEISGSGWRWGVGALVAAAIPLALLHTGPQEPLVVQRLLLAAGGVSLALGLGWLLLYVSVALYGYLTLGLFLLGAMFLAPLPLLFAVALIPFGLDFSLAGLVLDITAETTPPGTWTVHHIPDENPRAGDFPPGDAEVPTTGTTSLRHSMSYANPAAAELLSCWIRKRADNTAFPFR